MGGQNAHIWLLDVGSRLAKLVAGSRQQEATVEETMLKRSKNAILIAWGLLGFAVVILSGSRQADPRPVNVVLPADTVSTATLTLERISEYFDADDHEAIVEIMDKDGDGVVDGHSDDVWDHIERLYLHYNAQRFVNRWREQVKRSVESVHPEVAI